MVSLKHAQEQGSLRIAFYCVRPMGGRVCNHVGRVSIAEALKRWGGDRHLDAIPARCSRCGSADFVSARGEPPGVRASAGGAKTVTQERKPRRRPTGPS